MRDDESWGAAFPAFHLHRDSCGFVVINIFRTLKLHGLSLLLGLACLGIGRLAEGRL